MQNVGFGMLSQRHVVWTRLHALIVQADLVLVQSQELMQSWRSSHICVGCLQGLTAVVQ